MIANMNNPAYKGSHHIARLFLAQRGECFHCGKPMLWKNAHLRTNGFYHYKTGSSNNRGWTREHIQPVSKGGKNYQNIVLAHGLCNSKRGTETLSEELMAKAQNILVAAQKLSTGSVNVFLADESIKGTYVHCYDWPIDVGEPKFKP